MAERGFGGLPVRLQQLKMQLRMTINAILDQLVHCEDMTEAEAMALMTGRGFQEEGEAAGKWRRALLTSTQLSTYFVGYTEVAAIAAARPAASAATGTTRCSATAPRPPATCAPCSASPSVLSRDLGHGVDAGASATTRRVRADRDGWSDRLDPAGAGAGGAAPVRVAAGRHDRSQIDMLREPLARSD